MNTKQHLKENLSRLWGGRGEGQPNQPRQFSPPIQPTDFPTRQIRLEFDQTCLPYYTEIDAVCLLGTLHPITPSAKVVIMVIVMVVMFIMLIIMVGTLHPITRSCFLQSLYHCDDYDYDDDQDDHDDDHYDQGGGDASPKASASNLGSGRVKRAPCASSFHG